MGSMPLPLQSSTAGVALTLFLAACAPNRAPGARFSKSRAAASVPADAHVAFRPITVRAQGGGTSATLTHDGLTVMAHASPPTIAAYHVRSGKLKWSRPLAGSKEADLDIEVLGLDAAGRTVVVRDQSTTAVQAFDGGGEPLWSVEQPYWIHDAVVFDEHLALVHNGGVVVLETATGRRHAEAAFKATHGYATVAHVGSTLVVASPTHAHDGAISRYRIPDATLLWTRRLPFEHHGALLITSAAVLAESQGSVLHSLNLETGATQWQHSMGAPFDLLLVDAQPTVQGDDVTFTRPATVPKRPPRRVTIEGVVNQVHCGEVAHVEVKVDDALATTDEAGAYRITLEATGTMRVTVPGGLTDDQRVTVDERNRYVVSPITADFCDYD